MVTTTFGFQKWFGPQTLNVGCVASELIITAITPAENPETVTLDSSTDLSAITIDFTEPSITVPIAEC